MNAFWRARPSKHGLPLWHSILALLAIPLVGTANYYCADSRISFLLFYLPPIALVGWFGCSGLSIVAALAASGALLIADLERGQWADPGDIAYFNAAIRFAVLCAFGLLFAMLRQNRDRLSSTVTEKSSELQKEIAERTRIQREVAEIFTNQQRQVAYDLHDGVGQHLSGIAFKSKLLEQKLRAEGSTQADEAAAVTSLINEALRQTRMVARSMESTYGEAHGLRNALQKLAEELEQSSQVSATVTVDESSDAVGAPLDMQLFRITQEAIRNAMTHGGARNIEIGLQMNEEGILLTVGDDGQGFEGVPPGDGMGMRTMQYRAQTIGGSLVVKSRPGIGTTISCRVPKLRSNGKATTRISL